MTPLALAATAIGHASNVKHIDNHEPSWWLRARLVDIDTRWAAGTMRDCGHATEAPLIVALWDADRAWCGPCAVVRLKVEGDESYTCDRCGRIERPIQVCALAGRAAVVMLGLCSACNAREVGHR